MRATESMELSNINFHGAWNIISGKNCVAEKGDIIKKYSSKVFVVTGKNSAKASGALDDFINLFEKLQIEYKIFDKVTENPHIDFCRQAALECAEYGADGVLGIGGGSPLDTAKAVALLSQNLTTSDEDLYAKKVPNPPLPLFACGTTAGTGSEVTSYSIMTLGYGENVKKASWGSKAVIPTVTFADATYTLSMSRNSMLSTAIDAVSHGIEASLRKTTTVFVRMFAKETLSLVWPILKKMAEGEELTFDDRERVLYGSILGGFAIELSGSCFPHSAGYSLTTRYGIPHGFACSYFTAELLRVHMKDYKEYVAMLLHAMGSNIEEIERIFYSVIPSFERNENEFNALVASAGKSRNIHSALFEGDENFATHIFDVVYKTMDKYNK